MAFYKVITNSNISDKNRKTSAFNINRRSTADRKNNRRCSSGRGDIYFYSPNYGIYNSPGQFIYTPQISDGSPTKSLLRLSVRRGILTALALRKTFCS